MTSKEPLPSLDALKDKIHAHARRPAPASSPKPQGMGMAMRVGTEMVAAVAVGAMVGYVCDRWLGSFPLAFILCILLGFCAGMLTAIRLSQRSNDEDAS